MLNIAKSQKKIMLKEERFQYILERLSQDQKVLLSALSDELKVSEYTVRRDLKELSERGLLKAVRGGAVPHSPTPHHFAERLNYGKEFKEIMAKKALPLLQNGQVAIFDGGTSALAVAGILPDDLDITVVTNSFPIASVLESHPKIEVLFAGGRLYKSAFTTTGYDTIRFFKNIRADICFMGICSIHPELGVTTVNYEESEVKKAMVDSSKQIIALAMGERINTAEPYYICPSNYIDIIITDATAEESRLQSLKAAGLNIL